jgi:uncharacterized membrane protein YbhN (UPF0104 family)
MDEREPAAAIDGRSLAWRFGRLAALVAVAMLLIAKLPGLGEVRERLSRADTGWVALAMLLEAASVASFVVAFHCALERRLRRRTSSAVAMTAQGVNVLVPAGGTGGLAAATVIMARAGIPASFTAGRMVALFLLTAVATNVLLIIVGGLGVASGLLPGTASLAASLVPAVVTLIAVIGLMYVVRRLPRTGTAVPSPSRLRSIAQQAARYLREGIEASGELLRGGDPMLVCAALGYVLFDLAALAAAFRAVGSSGPPLGTMLLSYTLGQLGSVVSLPGTTEGGLIGAFVLYGAPLVLVTSAVLVFRAVQLVVPLALGLVGVVELRHLFRGGAQQEAWVSAVTNRR